MKKNQSRKNGFTLVEMMVAIAVFSIVMITAMGALINVIDANNKARSIKSAVNNISFALEGISKDMRMGSGYKCIDENGDDAQCSISGNVGVSYLSPKALNKRVYYRFIAPAGGAKGYLDSCVDIDINGPCSGSYSRLTSSEVNLKDVKFYVLGTANSTTPPPDRTQPRMIMTIEGEAGTKNVTTFDLQTGVSQVKRN